MTPQPHNTQFIKTSYWLTPCLLALLLVMQLKFWFGQGSVEQVTSLGRDIAEQEHANENLLKRNSVIMAEVDSLREDNAAIELRARSEFGMVKKGETFYLVVNQ